MTEASLDVLIDDTDRQLAAAQDAVGRGLAIDLRDLPARIERICALAVEGGAAPGTREKIAGLIARLDALEAQLRTSLAAASAQAPADARRAAALYRAGGTAPSDGKRDE